MTAAEVAAAVLAPGAPPGDADRPLAELGLDSLEAVEVLALVAEACPRIALGDDVVRDQCSINRLRTTVAAHRNLGPSAMTVTVDVPG